MSSADHSGPRSRFVSCRIPRRHRRRGAIAVLAAVLIVALLCMVAFAIDVGMICIAKGELQRSADAAAIAAAWELIDEGAPAGQSKTASAKAVSVAEAFAALNHVGTKSPKLASGDVTVGYMASPWLPSDPLLPYTTLNKPNAVEVRVQRTGATNGEIPLFFARIMGMTSTAVEAKATAALITNIGGFRPPADGSNLPILPIALDEETWLMLKGGQCPDNYYFDSSSGTIRSGKDGIQEVNLYPQATGSAGNRGTVDIGPSNNSTADISRQVEEGISAEDMENFYKQGRKLEFDELGNLYLNGDPGISAGIKDELASIQGKPRIIPIFRTVSGNGNNAEYTIVKFVGVRIMNVNLTGGSKKVIIQPANIVTKGGIPATAGESSYFIYSPVWLVR